MTRYKISQIDKDRSVATDVADSVIRREPSKDYYGDKIFITPRLPVRKDLLSIVQALSVLPGVNVADKSVTQQILSLNRNPSLADQLEDMSPAEWNLVFNYTQKSPPGAFSEPEHIDYRRYMEDENGLMPDPQTGEPMVIHYDYMRQPPDAPPPYNNDPGFREPNLIDTLKTLISLHMPYSTKQEAMASIQRLYNKVPIEQLQQHPGYAELSSINDDMYQAYALPHLLDELGINKQSQLAAYARMRDITAQENQPDISQDSLGDFIAGLVSIGFDVMLDPIVGKELLMLMPDNPHAQALLALPPEQWDNIAAGIKTQLNIKEPEPDRQTPEMQMALQNQQQQQQQQEVKKEMKRTPLLDQLAEVDDISGLKDWIARIGVEKFLSTETGSVKIKSVTKQKVAEMYDQFASIASEAGFNSLQYGDSSGIKITRSSGADVTVAKGGMWLYNVNTKEEAFVIGSVENILLVVTFPQLDVGVWEVPSKPLPGWDFIVEGKWQPGKVAFKLSIAQMAQDNKGNSVQSGDFIKSVDGPSGKVIEVDPSGRIFYQDDTGQKLMKEPGTDFEVIKPESQSQDQGATSDNIQQTGVGGPNMLVNK